MSEEIQYRKTISHTLVLHDPLSHAHILPQTSAGQNRTAVEKTPEKSRCFRAESFCKMFHKMFAEIRAKRQEWLSPSLTIYDNHLCGDECNSEVHSNRTEENQFFFPAQTFHIVSKTHFAQLFGAQRLFIDSKTYFSPKVVFENLILFLKLILP